MKIKKNILRFLFLILLLSCNTKKKPELKANNHPLLSCHFINSYYNPKTKMNERIFQHSVLNNSLDTIFIYVALSGFKPFRWIYESELDSNIVQEHDLNNNNTLDSMDFEPYKSIKYPIAPQGQYIFFDTIRSPFETLSNGFVFRYFIKDEDFNMRALCN